MNRIKRLICFLDGNHALSRTSTESGKGSDFRYIYRCTCGKRREHGPWTDDNHLMGYGKFK